MNHARIAALLLLFATASGHAQLPGVPESDSFIHTGDTPPPGFEDLAGPQLTLVDVYHGDRLVLSTMARYDLDTVELLDSAAVVAAIDRILDREQVTDALTGPLTTHANRLCRYSRDEDCGDIAPQVAGVVFDEQRFRLDVFVAPAYLQARPVHRSKFLPESTADFSTLHVIDFSASGGGLGEGGYNAGVTSLFARRADRVHTRYGASSDGYSVTELSWQRDVPGWRYEAGSFRSFGRSVAFVGEQDVVGARLGASLDTRADLQTADATPIFLFLNQRSRVDVRRDGRLLDSRYYDAGNQQLDTSRLPDGAYDIEVSSLNSDGREREQTFFFVRTARLPPIDQPLYYAEAGRLARTGDTTLPRTDRGNWLRAGTARRLTPHIGIEAELVHAGSTTLTQGGLFVFGPGWQFEAGLLASSASDRGISVRSHLRRGEAVLGLDWRHVVAGDIDAGTDQFDPVAESYTQGTLTLGLPVASGRLYGRAQIDQRGSSGNNTALGVSYARPILRRPSYSLDLDIDTTHDANETVLRIGVRGHWRRTGLDATMRPHLVAAFGDSDDGVNMLLDARASRDDRNTRLGDVTSSVFTASTRDERMLGAGIVSESDMGYANLEAQHSQRDGDSGLGYSGNARFSVVSDEGNMAWGGRRSDLSAVVLDIGGADDTDDTEFAVLVDRMPVGTVRAGRRSVLGLPPFDTYEIRLEPRSQNYVAFDERPRTVTLYPGNVETLRFDVTQLTVVVGQLVDAHGAPVADAHFDGISGYAGTDENGWFQIEITEREPVSVRRRHAPDCVVRWPSFTADDGLAVLDELTCVVTPATP